LDSFGATERRRELALHSARRPETILRGEAHPLYKPGGETFQAKAKRSAALARIRELEELMHLLGMTSARRTPGRKPKN